MANLNVLLNSNSAEFTNFFREPIIIPANSEIAMVKSSITVPVFQQQYLTIPELTGAQRALTMLNVDIDGITNSITWTDLYTAWSNLPNNPIDQQLTTTADDFFSGAYRFHLNNPVQLEDTGIDVSIKSSFNEAVAAAIDTKYSFYKVDASEKWERQDAQLLTDNTVSVNFINVGNYDKMAVYPNTQTSWGILANYSPVIGPEINITHAPADQVGWTFAELAGVQSFTSAGAGTAGTYDNIYINSTNMIDPNGGYLKFVAQITDNTCGVGLSISTGNHTDTAVNSPILPPSYTNTSIIDVGVLLTNNPTGDTVQFIDGQLRYGNHTGGNFLEDVISNLVPNQSYLKFDATDEWYIRMCRVGPNSPNEFKYCVTILRDDTAGGLSAATKVYESTMTLASPALSVSPIFLSDGQANVITETKIVSITTDSQEQGDLNANGLAGQQNILIYGSTEVERNTQTIRNDVINFYEILGLERWHSVNDGYTQDDSNVATNNPLSMKWETPLQSNSKNTIKFIGINQMNKIYNQSSAIGIDVFDPLTAAQAAAAGASQSYAVSSLPRFLEVALIDMPIKNISGNAPANSINGIAQPQNDTATIDRIVGTIPTDLKADNNTNFEWELDYEPFTPVYRPLNNPVPLNIQQLQVEISYRDFGTGVKKRLDHILGTVNLELHIKPGRVPPKIVNNLRPF